MRRAAPIRQLAVRDLGHDQPTLLLTNQMDETPARLVDRYARRMIIENTIADAIDFFHMDALSAAVPMKIDLDVQLTLMASALYRILGRRAHNPLLLEAGYADTDIPLPWLDHRTLRIRFV